MIAYRGISGLDEIPEKVSRQELHDRFGTPISSTTAESGRQVEVFKIQLQLADREQVFVSDFVLHTGLFGYYVLLWPFVIGRTFIRSEANKIDVAFVYGSDDRALYYYILNSEPGSRYLGVTRGLVNPVLDNSAFEKCPNVTACVQDYIAELRLRALETGYELQAAREEEFQQLIEVARDLDSRKINREDAIKRLNEPPTSQ